MPQRRVHRLRWHFMTVAMLVPWPNPVVDCAFVFCTGDGDVVLHADSTEHDGAGHDEQGDGKDPTRESNQTVMTE